MLRCHLLIIGLVLYISGFAQKDTLRLKPQRLSHTLQQLLVRKTDDSVELVLTLNKNYDMLKNGLKFRLLEHYSPANLIRIKVKLREVEGVLKAIDPTFANISLKPKEELTTGSLDISLNRLNYVHSKLPVINGDGVMISIKEQQYDTTDIDYYKRHFNSGRGAQTSTTHASIMATIAAGAANSSPFAAGAAPAVYLTSSSFASLLPDPDSIYQTHNISVQNHSYGTVVESFYGNEAYAYDVSSFNNPGLLHVFSSGNSGDTSAAIGAYIGIRGFANLTGNFKHAKNILTVGAVDSFKTVEVRSSKGPAFDGRVKPDVVAFGADGSSGAAALVSGTVTLVQQAYRQKNNGQTPEAALVKAIIINSADDIGNKNVDYTSGYGNINAWKAVTTVIDNRFFSASLSQGASKSFPITVPAGVSQLKVTIVWADTPASPNALKALVNDVDAAILLPATNESWLPWVLSPVPNVDSLRKPARRKLDTLNNVEQITIDNPLPGSYLLQVKGTRIITQSQDVFAAIQMDTSNSFIWTFPAAGDQLIAGEENVIRWQTNRASTGKLEYTFDGNNWQTISDAVVLDKEHYKWLAPGVMKRALLRMSVNEVPVAVSDTFNISRQTRMQAGFNCEDSFLLYWDALPSTSQYQVYQLGDKYLQPTLLVQDTFIVLQKSQNPSLFYAVAPLVEGKAGLRSYTVNYKALGVGCYFKGFFVQEKTEAYVEFRSELGSLYHVAEITLQKQGGNNFIDLSSINSPHDLSVLFRDSSLVQGIQYYRLRLKLSDNTIVYSEVISVTHFTSLPILIYPNPSRQGQAVVVLTNDPGRYNIEIIDMQGRKVKEYQLQNEEEQIPPFILSKGVYIIRIQSEEGKIGVQKLIVY